MSLKSTLNRLIRVVIEEAERNQRFESALSNALESTPSKRKSTNVESSQRTDANETKRGKHRRTPAVLDPVQVARDSESALRSALEKLTLEQLRDIVAEHGMDPGRLVMKWNTPERVIDRIVEMAIARAHKGNAFRKPAEDSRSSTTHTDETALPDTHITKNPPEES